MASKLLLYTLPLPSTELDDDLVLCGDVLRFLYRRDGFKYQAGIKFEKVAATRTRAERCCTAWHIDVAYDVLVSVEDSDWLKQITAETAEQWRDKWTMHHYMIYADSVGCFELIAESFRILPERMVS
jgi:hypothetical protein